MDRTELVGRLREAGVPEALYEITGVHDVPVQPDAFYVLRPEGNGWTVGLRERSRDREIRHFATEDEACAYLYDALTRVPPPAPGVAEPLEQLLADPEEIQRQAWEDFERAARHDRAPAPPEEKGGGGDGSQGENP
ncbi:hypothetical protein ACFZAR_11580 [Streptomyces sp. NPDC008222]|uniref:hypothetical protein n=1 Tax=Streptomyces sp. NPDC008222 TaxID=3364820 RepID=UPI0036F12E50